MAQYEARLNVRKIEVDRTAREALVPVDKAATLLTVRPLSGVIERVVWLTLLLMVSAAVPGARSLLYLAAVAWFLVTVLLHLAQARTVHQGVEHLAEQGWKLVPITVENGEVLLESAATIEGESLVAVLPDLTVALDRKWSEAQRMAAIAEG